MVHCPACGIVPVPEKDLPVLLPEGVKDFIPKGRSPLADVESYISTACPECGGAAKRDPDTMDTFMCSSWYLFRYADPKNDREPFRKSEIAKWLPIDLYIGGAEHACMHLIYFRFFTKVLCDAGYLECDEPAARLFNQGMVKNAAGEVMSKAKGNAVSPTAIFDAHGVDAARVAMAFFAPSDADINWKEEGVQGARRLLARVCDLVDRCGGAACCAPTTAARGAGIPPSPGDREIRRLAHVALQRATEAYETDFAFNTVVARIYELVNAIEKAGAAAPRPEGDRPACGEAVRLLVQVLAPIAPHLGEELWERLGHTKSVFLEPWPAVDPAALAVDEVEIPVQVNGKLRGKVVVPAGAAEAEVRERALADPKVREHLGGRPPKKVIVVPGRLVNVVVG